MSYLLLVFGLLVLSAGFYCRYTLQSFDARIRRLEQDLHSISDVVTQMTEIQIKTFEKHSASLEGLEERIIELSVPSQDSSLPLERRHQVLALARQGLGLEDIVKRLKAPAGEAEVILNLQKYMGAKNARSSAAQKRVGSHA